MKGGIYDASFAFAATITDRLVAAGYRVVETRSGMATIDVAIQDNEGTRVLLWVQHGTVESGRVEASEDRAVVRIMYSTPLLSLVVRKHRSKSIRLAIEIERVILESGRGEIVPYAESIADAFAS